MMILKCPECGYKEKLKVIPLWMPDEPEFKCLVCGHDSSKKNLTQKLVDELQNEVNRGCHTPMEAIYLFLIDDDTKQLNKEIKDCEYCQKAVYDIRDWMQELIDSGGIPSYEECFKKAQESTIKAMKKHMG